MDRSAVCQLFVDSFVDCRYLEIGVNQGLTFEAVRAKDKTAVDPLFLFDKSDAAGRNPHSHYKEVTSDAYFEELPKERQFDVVYLDGLHTFEQTLRDLLNAIDHLSADGIIIIDDVRPTSYAASVKSMEAANVVKSLTADPDLAWMGDVYRLVWFISSFMQQYTFHTVSDNHGQIVMWRQVRPALEVQHRLVHDVATLTFEEMAHAMHVFAPLPASQIHRKYMEQRSAFGSPSK